MILIDYISVILDLYFIKLDIPRKLVICLSIDALFIRIVSLGRVQGE